jgi:hypothetical protein
VWQRLAAHRQREQQHDGAEGELAEDDLNRAEPAQRELDEQNPDPHSTAKR